MPSASYDVVAIGDDTATLAAAALCAKRGLRTLWVTSQPASASYSLGAFTLPFAMQLVPKNAPGVTRVLRELGAEVTWKRKLREGTQGLQLFGPDMRLALGDTLARDLARESLADAPAAWEAMQMAASAAEAALTPALLEPHGFPASGFFQRRESTKRSDAIRRAVDAFEETLRTLVPAVPAASVWASQLARYPAPPTLAQAYVWRSFADGVAAARHSGGEPLRDLLRERFATAGGETRIGKLTGTTISWGKCVAITLDQQDTIGCNNLLAGLPLPALVTALGDKAPDKLAQAALGLTLAGYRYTLNLVIEDTGLPEGLGHAVAATFAHGSDTSTAPASLTLHVGEPDDRGRVILTAEATIEVGAPLAADDQREYAVAMRRRVWRSLDMVMPFFDRHVVVAHSPHDGWAPMAATANAGTRSGPIYSAPHDAPWQMAEIWNAALPDTFELAATTPATGIKNITLCGEQLWPALGLDGALTANWLAANTVCALAGKKKDYLRDETVGVTRPA